MLTQESLKLKLTGSFADFNKGIILGLPTQKSEILFYRHRFLSSNIECHVLIELKTEQAKYEHIGQLKVYLQHYKHKVVAKTDNPPVGILLVTVKKKTVYQNASFTTVPPLSFIKLSNAFLNLFGISSCKNFLSNSIANPI